MTVRFAFSLAPTADLPSFSRTIEWAERRGFSVAYVPDQAFFRDPFVALAHVATRTSRIDLGLAVTNPYTRHPALVARAAGTLADLLRGRFILGLGAGNRGGLRDRLGTPPGEFLPLVRVAIEAIRALLDGREVTADTPVFRMKKVRLDFVPQSRVPIFLATTDPEGFRLAGTVADGLILGDIADPEAVRHAVALMAEGARAAGRNPAEIVVVSWVATVVTEDVEGAKRHLRPVIGSAISSMHPATRAVLRVDTTVATAVRDAQRRGDAVTESLLSDSLIDRFAMVGDPGTVARRMRALREAGATELAIRMPAKLAEVFDFQGVLEAVATQVMPQVVGAARGDDR